MSRGPSLRLAPPSEAKPLTVYGWQGYRQSRTDSTRGCVTREICAARSKAEVARLAGKKRPEQLFNLSETFNETERVSARFNPRKVIWRDERERDIWTIEPGGEN